MLTISQVSNAESVGYGHQNEVTWNTAKAISSQNNKEQQDRSKYSHKPLKANDRKVCVASIIVFMLYIHIHNRILASYYICSDQNLLMPSYLLTTNKMP